MSTDRTREFLLYGAAAGCALMTDIALLVALIELAKIHYLVAATTSFAAATLVAYFLCVRFVFRHRRLDSMAPELGIFAAVGTAGLGVNAAIMFTGVELLGLHFVPTKLGAAGVTFMTNFVLRKVLLFQPRQRESAQPVRATRPQQ